MERAFLNALMKAAQEAWETGQLQPVKGVDGMAVTPDSAMIELHALAAAHGTSVREPDGPTVWIEHEGRRAQVVWLAEPLTPAAEA